MPPAGGCDSGVLSPIGCRFPGPAGQPVSVSAVSPSASRCRVAASWLRAGSGSRPGSCRHSRPGRRRRRCTGPPDVTSPARIFRPGLPPRVHDTGFSCAFSRVLSGCRREQPVRLRFHTKAQPDASDRSPARPRLTLASTTGPRCSRAEAAVVIAACSATSRTGIRNRALITVLCRAGLRISEALRCARSISTGAPRGTRHGRQRPQATDGRPGLRRHGHHPAVS